MNTAKRNYRKKIRRIYIELYGTDDDIKLHLDNIPEPITTYLKALIRADIQSIKGSE